MTQHRIISGLSLLIALGFGLAHADDTMPGIAGMQAPLPAVSHPATTGASSGVAPPVTQALKTPRPALDEDTISLGAEAISPEGPSAPGFCTASNLGTADATGFGAPLISGC